MDREDRPRKDRPAADAAARNLGAKSRKRRREPRRRNGVVFADKLEGNRYLGALRRLSRKGDPGPLVAAMARLWDFGRLLAGSDFEAMRRRLEAANAFSDDDDAILRF